MQVELEVVGQLPDTHAALIEHCFGADPRSRCVPLGRPLAAAGRRSASSSDFTVIGEPVWLGDGVETDLAFSSDTERGVA